MCDNQEKVRKTLVTDVAGDSIINDIIGARNTRFVCRCVAGECDAKGYIVSCAAFPARCCAILLFLFYFLTHEKRIVVQAFY